MNSPRTRWPRTKAREELELTRLALPEAQNTAIFLNKGITMKQTCQFPRPRARAPKLRHELLLGRCPRLHTYIHDNAKQACFLHCALDYHANMIHSQIIEATDGSLLCKQWLQHCILVLGKNYQSNPSNAWKTKTFCVNLKSQIIL